MRQMDSIGIIVAQLIDGFPDLVVLFGGHSLSHEPFEPCGN